MKTLNRIILLFCTILMLTGCKKELEFTFKGKVTNRQSGEVIPNLLVKVFQDEGSFNSSYKLVGSGTTNGSGEFEIVVPREQVNGLKVQTADDQFHKEFEIIGFDELSTEDDNVVNLETAYRSWVNISFINPDEASNAIYYNKTDGNTQCEECCANESTYYNGITDDYQICGADGNTYFYYNIVVPGESVTLDSLLCLPLDTTYKTINF